MDLVQVIVLALIQGLTEFLPISSSAHLILPKEVWGWPDQGLAFDVAVHVGTLMAVMVYFRDQIVELTHGWFRSVSGKGMDESGKLAWLIALATVPAGLVGLILGDFIETNLRSMAVIATTTIVFGLLLAYADKSAAQKKTIADMSVTLAWAIGCSQALALIPGTSRSGITITIALILGFTRTDAARFSFLLSIPIILLSGGLKGVELLGEANVDWFAIIVGTIVSGVSAYACIHFFLAFINKMSMLPFVIYRLVLGVLLLGIVFF